MKINLAKSVGFCFGVKRAVDIALKTSSSEKDVYMLGDIVHNENVISEIEKSGIKKIKQLGAGTGKILLIRAHGSDIKTIEDANKHGYAIIDATCPMVREIHNLSKRMESQEYTIIVIGEKDHDEVKGIVGQLKNTPIVINQLEDLSILKEQKIKKAAIVVQSTQNTYKVSELVDEIRKHVDELVFHNTICQPTRIKQQEAKKLPLENDVIIVIGSKTSANTKRLYEISKSLNNQTYWIESKDKVNTAWFKGMSSVGILAGASTPDSSINEIIQHLQTID